MLMPSMELSPRDEDLPVSSNALRRPLADDCLVSLKSKTLLLLDASIRMLPISDCPADERLALRLSELVGLGLMILSKKASESPSARATL
jgi:hypothetical protein